MAWKDLDKKRAYQRSYDQRKYWANPEKARARVREYAERNREAQQIKDRRRYSIDRLDPVKRAKAAARTRQWNLNNPASKRAGELKREVFHLLDNRCALCGWDDERVLQVDHIHGGGRKEQRENRQLLKRVRFYRAVLQSLKTNKGEFRLLCANCNHIDARQRLFIREEVRLARTQLIIEMGSQCVRCEYVNPEGLHIDHVNNDGYATWGSRGGSRLLYFKKIRQQPNRFQLLCANCNWLKRLESKSGQLEAA